MSLDIIGTFYVPEGKTRTVTFPQLREGNDSSRVLLVDDRGTLMAPCYVEEADTDGLLMLKQYNADRVIASIEAAVEWGDRDPSGPWEITRTDDGTYHVEHAAAHDASDAM